MLYETDDALVLSTSGKLPKFNASSFNLVKLVVLGDQKKICIYNDVKQRGAHFQSLNFFNSGQKKTEGHPFVIFDTYRPVPFYKHCRGS